MPFLDHKLVELAARMSTELKLKEGASFRSRLLTARALRPVTQGQNRARCVRQYTVGGAPLSYRSLLMSPLHAASSWHRLLLMSLLWPVL